MRYGCFACNHLAVVVVVAVQVQHLLFIVVEQQCQIVRTALLGQVNGLDNLIANVCAVVCNAIAAYVAAEHLAAVVVAVVDVAVHSSGNVGRKRHCAGEGAQVNVVQFERYIVLCRAVLNGV